MTPEEKRIRPERLHAERVAGTRLTRRVAAMDGEEVADGEIYRNPPGELIARIYTELFYARPGQQRAAHLSDDDVTDALVLLDRARRELEAAEGTLIAEARQRGIRWRVVAAMLDLDSAQAAEQRQKRLMRRGLSSGWEQADAGYVDEPDNVVIYDEHHRRTPGGGYTCEHDVREVGCTHARGYPEPFDERALLAAQCRACSGQGFTMTECATCAGSGRVFDEHDQDDELGQLCRTCAGQGLLRTECSICESTGKAPAASAGPTSFEQETP